MPLTVPAIVRRYGGVVVALMLLCFVTVTLTSLHHRLRETRAEQRAAEAERLLKAEKVEDAIRAYRSALSFSPGDREYSLQLALALIRAGRWAEATLRLAQLREGDPTNALINLNLARSAARTGNLDDSIALYRNAVYGSWPDNGRLHRLETRLELARQLLGARRRAQAIAELGEAVDDADREGKMRIAQTMLEAGAAHEAANVFQEITTEEPSQKEAWIGLGEATLASGDYQVAQRAFARAVRLSPRDQAAREGLTHASDVLRLDPTPVRLSTRQRWLRSREVLARATAAFEQCLADKTPPEAIRSAVERAGKMRKTSCCRTYDPADFLATAQELWSARRKLCEKSPVRDSALATVMEHLAR